MNKAQFLAANPGAATAAAMEAGRPFSWLKTQRVQAGVYLWYTQVFFNKYELPRRAAGVGPCSS